MPGRFLILFASVYLLIACEPNGPITDNAKVNEWIHGVMEANYLWSDYMPEEWEEGKNLKPSNFFDWMLYNDHEDIDLNDLYSKIIFTGTEAELQAYNDGSEYAIEAPSYHFGFATRLITSSTGFCHVMYVLPNSPADRAGIKRGDCFTTVNGIHIKEKNELDNLLEKNDRIEVGFYYPEEKTVTLTKSFYYDNPVYFDTIYELNPKTGYFIYNHFTDGDNDRYYNALKDVFAGFLAEGVENVIADFRFNGGGEMTAARKVASLLAPQASLGNVYLYKERRSSYNDPSSFEPETLHSPAQMQGYNCGLQSLYVITNKNTASASELVIHCLRPLYENEGLKFVHAGEQTEGKNLGGVWYSHASYQWEIYPITLRIHNINKVSGYEAGLVPDIKITEYDNENYPLADNGYPYAPLGQLGDISEEPMLRRVMDDIYGIGGWHDLLPADQLGNSGPTRSAAYTQHTPATATGLEAGTTIRYRPLTERRER